MPAPNPHIPKLADLGDRIVILGPSNAGKSTLAAAIGQARDLPVVHLDQLRFLPDTDWVERPDEAFAALHDEAIAQDRWVIEGNYTSLMPARLDRASGLILIRPNRFLRFFRYVRRTLWQSETRIGSLAGGKDSLKWEMVDWVLFKSPPRARRYAKMIRATGKPMVDCRTTREIDGIYRQWGLKQPF